jgi:hypothetical protein
VDEDKFDVILTLDTGWIEGVVTFAELVESDTGTSGGTEPLEFRVVFI